MIALKITNLPNVNDIEEYEIPMDGHSLSIEIAAKKYCHLWWYTAVKANSNIKQAINGRLIEFEYGARKKYSQTLSRGAYPSGGNGYGRGDIEIAEEQGKAANGTRRNIVVNYSHIYLYNGSNIGIQIKRQ